MKVLVTGANGFVGARLVARLCADGHDVVGARGPDNATAARAAARPPGVTWVSLDVTDDASVRACVAPPCDAVVHLAGVALASEANEDPGRAWRVNAEGTARVAWQLADVAKARRPAPLLLVVSSGEVYVPRTDRPHVESDPVAPVTGYAASKLGVELAGLYGLSPTDARSLVEGLGMRVSGAHVQGRVDGDDLEHIADESAATGAPFMVVPMLPR